MTMSVKSIPSKQSRAFQVTYHESTMDGVKGLNDHLGSTGLLGSATEEKSSHGKRGGIKPYVPDYQLKAES